VPFDASTVNELIFRIVLEAPPPLATAVPDVDPELAAIVAKAMAREPAERFASARAFHDALVGWLGQARGRAAPSKDLANGPTPRAFAAPSVRRVPPAAPSEGDTLIWDRAPPRRRGSVAIALGVVGAILAAAAILFAFRPSSERVALPAAPAQKAEPTATAPPAPEPARTAEAAAPSTPASDAATAEPAPQREAAKPAYTSPPRVPSPKRVVRRTVSSEL
jgi:serine/threonine-protein kinase